MATADIDIGTNGKYLIRFPYRPDVLEAIKAIPSRKWFSNIRAHEINAHDVEPTINALRAIGCIIMFSPTAEKAITQYITEKKNLVILKNQPIDLSRPPLTNLKLPLRPFQIVGQNYLISAKSCLLCDEMGVGKSAQIISSFKVLKEQGKVNKMMVLCPSSVKGSWASDIIKFTDLVSVIIEGTPKQRRLLYQQSYDIIIIGYETYLSDFSGTRDADSTPLPDTQVLVCDECVDKNSIISTPNGEKEICRLKIGDMVYGFDGNNVIVDKVVNVWNRGIKPVYKIKLNNKDELVVTGNHKIFTSIGWKTVSELKDIDYSLISLYSYPCQKHQGDLCEKTVNFGNFIRRWFFEFIQRVNKSKTTDTSFLETESICLSQVGNIKRLVQDSNKKNSEGGVGRRYSTTLYSVFTTINALLQTLLSIWEKTSIFTMGQSTYAQRIGLLVYGRWKYISTETYNGNINPRVYIRGKQDTSINVIKQVWGKINYYFIQKNKQIFPNVSCHRKKQIPQFDKKICYSINEIQNLYSNFKKKLCWVWKNIPSFAIQFPLSFSRMFPKILLDASVQSTVGLKIKEIIEYGKTEVWDIETEKTHTFFANNILVHNCQRLVRFRNKTTQAILILKEKLNLDYIYLLTGTPIVNRVEDLWSLLYFVNPELVGEFWQFRNRYCVIEYQEIKMLDRAKRKLGIFEKIVRKIPKVIGYKNLEELKARIEPYYIRREKKDVLKDLPDKIYETLEIELTKKQRELYEFLRADFDNAFRDIDVTPANALVWFIRGKQICDSAEIVDAENKESAKLDELRNLLEDLMPRDNDGKYLPGAHSVVLFSQYREMTDILVREFEDYLPLYLHGQVKSQDRQVLIDEFQNNSAKHKLFISTLRAGGVGITLTAADVVILYDKWFSPSANNQAMDRVYRIGQKNAVTVIDFICRDTIEERIEKILERKRNMFEGIFGEDESILVKLTSSELKELL